MAFDFQAQGFGPLKSELLGYDDDFFCERALHVFYYKIRGKLDNDDLRWAALF
jgi:hypothetical protein